MPTNSSREKLLLNRKLNKKEENYTNIELYENLSEILDILGKNRDISEPKIFRPNKIIVE